MITIYGFGRVPDLVVGLTRDLRVLWAAEELGLPYQVHALDFETDLRTDAYKEKSDFGQVPVIDDGGFVLAESGAILLYLAEKAGAITAADVRRRYEITEPARDLALAGHRDEDPADPVGRDAARGDRRAARRARVHHRRDLHRRRRAGRDDAAHARWARHRREVRERARVPRALRAAAGVAEGARCVRGPAPREARRGAADHPRAARSLRRREPVVTGTGCTT
ncbi:MAG: hypothetical protein E6J90_53180 [Deltaproteobacteria bacterium]|nr:MAG: hypothetical protein E6J90_53180 [Deltaproteobacteria bacterium]